MLDELTQLALKYGTDKWGKHHYTPVYYDLFRDKTKMVKKVLEIGVAEGAGLFMFRDFFPNARIYGAEIDQKRVYNLNNQEPRDFRIEIFECDQSKSSDLYTLISETGDDLDIVIDDGSHKFTDQLETCMTLMSMLTSKVTYIIEDVKKDDAKLMAQTIDSFYDCQIVEVGNRYDDCLVIVRKK